MHRFNLTFKGEIQPGYQPDKVQQRFAELLGIADSKTLEHCFSGESLTLRSDLDRKTAADLFYKLNQLGAQVELLRDDSLPHTRVAHTASMPDRTSSLHLEHEHIDQKWAVSNAARIRDGQQQPTERAEQRIVEQAQQEAATRAAAKLLAQQQAAKIKARKLAEQKARRQSRRAQAQARAAKRRAAKAAAQASRRKAAAEHKAEIDPDLPPTDRQQHQRSSAALAALSSAREKLVELTRRSGSALNEEAQADCVASPSDQPNFYALTPFRNTAALRERPQRAQTLKLRYIALAAVALLALIATYQGRSLLLPALPPGGALAMAASAGGELVLATGDTLLIHDRSGHGIAQANLSQLGLGSVDRLFAAAEGGGYYVLASALAADPESPVEPLSTLWHCNFDTLSCAPFGPRQPAVPTGLVVHPDSGMLLQALPQAGVLRKLQADGTEAASAPYAFSADSTLLLSDGLLFTNSTRGPALSVLRYEDNALGQQLDEILLLAPPALDMGREHVGSFAQLGDLWWTILVNPRSRDSGLYLFDDQWSYLRELPLPDGFIAEQLLVWGQKLLVLDSSRPLLQRFNEQGQPEVPLASDLLLGQIDSRQQRLWLHNTLWQSLATLCYLILAGAALMAYLHYLRQIAFRPDRLRGATPLESAAADIFWVAKPTGRKRTLQRLSRLYLALCCVLLVTAVTLRIEADQLTALLLLLAGPAFAVELYVRSPDGQIGALGEQLVLVDHRNTYHVAQGARILYRNWFLMIDDVLVFAGPGWLPGFATDQLEHTIVPLSRLGVRVGRGSVLARMVEARHPLAVGAGMILLAIVAALSVLVSP